MEIRHDSFIDPGFIKLLRKYRIGLVVSDTVDWPLLMDMTSDFVYCQLHGSEELYASGYNDASLGRWANRIAAWAMGRENKDVTRVLTSRPLSGRREMYSSISTTTRRCARHSMLDV